MAHAALIASEPADGARLSAAPRVVELRFDEVVTPLSLGIAGPGLGVLPLPPPGEVLRLALPDGAGEAVYIVSWRVVSADGHPVAGAFAYIVGAGALPAAPTAPTARAPGWVAALASLRLALYLLVAAGAGGALFRALVAEPPARIRRGIVIASTLGVLVAAASVGSFGGLLADAPAGGLLQAATWRLAVGTPFAASLTVAAAGLAIAAVTALRPGRLAAGLGGIGAVVVALGMPLAGHAATAEPRWLAATALATHVLAIVYWLGAFWPLQALLAERGAGAAAAVRRFSYGALVAVGVVLAAGVTLAALRLPELGALFASDYGRLLLGKTLGLAALLGLAGWNRQRLTPALVAGAPRAAATLRRSIGLEMAIAVVILGLTTVLVRTPPPGAAHRHDHAAAPRQDLAVATEFGGRSLLLVLTPEPPSGNRLTLWAGLPAPAEAWVELEQPALGIGPLRRRLQPDGAGRFSYAGPELTTPGRWQIRIELLISDFEQLAGVVGLDLPAGGGR